jgi:hypothetical protein
MTILEKSQIMWRNVGETELALRGVGCLQRLTALNNTSAVGLERTQLHPNG